MNRFVTNSDVERVISLFTRKAQVQVDSLWISPMLLTLFHGAEKEGMPPRYQNKIYSIFNK